MTIKESILKLLENQKRATLYFVILVKYSFVKQDNKSILSIDFFKPQKYEDFANYKYDEETTLKAKPYTIKTYFIDITENAQKIAQNKLKKLNHLDTINHIYKKPIIELKKEYKNLCKTPLFKRDTEQITKQFVNNTNKLFEELSSKLFDEKLINKYSVFFEALDNFKQRTKNNIIFVISRSLFVDKDNQAKSFLKETTILNVYEMMTALNICLKKNNINFDYDKLSVWTKLRHIRKKWQQKKAFKLLYDRLFLKNLELYKDHAKAKQETLKAMPTKYKQVKEILSSLDKQTS